VPEVPRETADRLYAAPPERFVALRAAAVQDARAAGDPALARAIAALRKPTVAAWLLNLLAIRRPELVAELADLATQLRTAQRELRGPQLRELSARRRAAVAALVAQARELAAAADPGLDSGRLPLVEVEQTLTAALADAEVADLLRAGRLLRPVRYAGFGEVPRPQLRLVTGGAAGRERGGAAGSQRAGAPRPRPGGAADPPTGGAARSTGGGSRGAAAASRTESGPDSRRSGGRRATAEPAPPPVDRAAIRRELSAARTARSRAQAQLDRAAAAERQAADALAEIEASLAELERRRAAAEADLDRCRLARKGAERDLTAARRRYGLAEAAREAADAPDPG